MKHREFAIIGAGRLAHSIAPALISAGIPPGCVCSRSAKKAKAFAREFHIPKAVSSLQNIPVTVTHYLLTVTDSALPGVVSSISQELTDFNKKTFVHFSGALDSSVFSALEKAGALGGSFHILQSFPTTATVPIAGCAAACESGSTAGYRELIALAKILQLRPFKIEAEKKTLYHIMGVVLSNFLTGNLAMAEALFKACKLHGISFRKLAEPIIERTLQNAWDRGIDASLSGPVERNDSMLIQAHIEALKNDPAVSHYLNNYLLQSAGLVPVAKRKNPKNDYSQTEKLLKI